MFSWLSISVLILLFLLLVWWLQHSRAREGAIAAVKNACKRYDYQLLDGSVHLQKVRLTRSFMQDDPQRISAWCIRWVFCFDYFDGDRRCQGLVYWNCGKLERLKFVENAANSDNNKVVSLDDFRRK